MSLSRAEIIGTGEGIRLSRCAPRLAHRLIWLVLMATAAAAPVPAEAHSTWANGMPIPAWVLRACCGPNDAHHLSPDQVRRIPDGYRIDGYPRPIYDAQVLPSEDGEYWAFYSTYVAADGTKAFSSVFCFFAPSLG